MLLIFSGLSRGGEADAPFITTLQIDLGPPPPALPCPPKACAGHRDLRVLLHGVCTALCSREYGLVPSAVV